MITNNYKSLAAKTFNQMTLNYPGAFFRGEYSDITPAIIQWVKTLVAAGVKESEIEIFTNFIIQDYEKTRNVPPENNEISSVYQAFKTKNEGPKHQFSSELDKEIYEAYRYMIFKYERLFKNESFTREEHFKLWSDDIKASGVTSNGVKRAALRIKSSAEHSQYPPNIGQFITMALVLSIDEGIPMPDEAFTIAINNRELKSYHPIISYVRSIIGYENLVKNARFLNKTFSAEYQNAVIKFLNNEIELTHSSSTKEQKEESPRLSSSTVADEIWELLNG